MKDFIEKVLVPRKDIKDRTRELASKITKDYRDEQIILIGVLKGGFIFLADLMREIRLPLSVDLITVSSYGSGTESTGVVKLKKDIDINIENKNVLLVEDIVDSGNSVKFLKDMLLNRNPKSVKICSLLDKPNRRKVDVKVDYVGFVIPDEFVIGYGLDYDEKYRELPDICVLNPSEYNK